MKLKPSELMREWRPHLFSDSETQARPEASRALVEYHLDTLTSRGQERQFEDFCRRLLELEVCPNIRPQSGPVGGGDSHLDASTYPVSDDHADRFYSAVARAATHEVWGFAFSAKEQWRPKAQSDIRKIAKLLPKPSLAYFVTNQFTPDKKRSDLEKKLSVECGMRVEILDRSWIVSRLIDHDRLHVAIERLGLDIPTRPESKVGPNDASRLHELEPLLGNLRDIAFYSDRPWLEIGDCIEAGRLARGLDRPREEVVGFFERARRIADKHQLERLWFEASYHLAWSQHWWFDDTAALADLYDEIVAREALLYDSEIVNRLTNLLMLQMPNVDTVGGSERLGTRRRVLEDRLKHYGSQLNTPAAALNARATIAVMQLLSSMECGDMSLRDSALEAITDCFQESESIVHFSVETYARQILMLGPDLDKSPRYSAAAEAAERALLQRAKSASTGVVKLARATPYLERERIVDALPHLGHARLELAGRSQDSGLYALVDTAQSYDSLGFVWAARAEYTHIVARLIAQVASEGHQHELLEPVLWKLAFLELRCGRLAASLRWRQIVRELGLERAAAKPSLEHPPTSYDVTASIALLRTSAAQLPQLSVLPDLLGILGMKTSRWGLLFALGHWETVFAEDPDKLAARSDANYAETFSSWLGHEAEVQMPDRFALHATGASDLYRSVVHGVEVELVTADTVDALALAEDILAGLEAGLATGTIEHLLPVRKRFVIRLEIAAEPKCRSAVSTDPGVLTVTVGSSALPDGTVEEVVDYQKWLAEIVSRFLASCFIPRGGIEALSDWVEKSGFLSRAVALAPVAFPTSRIFGRNSAARLDDLVAGVELRDYAFTRDSEWFNLYQVKVVDKGANEARKAASATKIDDLIEMDQWDRARWLGTCFLTTPRDGDMPFVGLVFESVGGARAIYERWKSQAVDSIVSDLRLVFVEDRKNHSKYAVVVSADIERQMNSGAYKQLAYAPRVLESPRGLDDNLGKFKRAWGHVGRAGLLIMVARPSGIEIVGSESDFEITNLHFKDVSEIGDLAPERVARRYF